MHLTKVAFLFKELVDDSQHRASSSNLLVAHVLKEKSERRSYPKKPFGSDYKRVSAILTKIRHMKKKFKITSKIYKNYLKVLILGLALGTCFFQKSLSVI